MENKENFRMTAEALAEFFERHKEDGVLTRIFEMEYSFQAVMERYGAAEVVRRIQKWEAEYGKSMEEMAVTTFSYGLGSK